MFKEIFVLVFIQNYSYEFIYPNFRGTIYPNLRRTAPLLVIKYSRSDATAALPQMNYVKAKSCFSSLCFSGNFQLAENVN